MSPFGPDDSSCFGFADRISVQIAKHVSWTMLGVVFGLLWAFEQMMNARQEFAIGYSAHGLGVGMSSFPAFVIEGGTVYSHH